MSVTRICKHCGKSYNTKPSANKHYCSSACYFSAKKGQTRAEYLDTTCQTCGKSMRVARYKWNQGEGRYCSPKCRIGRPKKRVMKTCEYCGTDYELYASAAKPYKGYERKYCSADCRRVAIKGTKRAPVVDSQCPTCGKTFQANKSDSNRGRSIYCSQECHDKRGHNRTSAKVTAICQYCGKEYETWPCWIRDGRKFCSKACAWNGRERHSFKENVPTNIEQALIDEMDRRSLAYETQYHIGWYILDFAFPDVCLDVEADGTYWHAGERMAKHDRRRDGFLHSRGWLTLRFTETEINASPQQCVDIIEHALFELRDEHHYFDSFGPRHER